MQDLEVEDALSTGPTSMETSSLVDPQKAIITDADLYWPLENTLRDFPFAEFITNQTSIMKEEVSHVEMSTNSNQNKTIPRLSERGCVMALYSTVWSAKGQPDWMAFLPAAKQDKETKKAVTFASKLDWKPLRALAREMVQTKNPELQTMDFKVLQTYDIDKQIPLWICVAAGPTSKKDSRGFSMRSQFFLLRRRVHEPQQDWTHKLNACLYYCPVCYQEKVTGPGNRDPREKMNSQDPKLQLCSGCNLVWYCSDQHRQQDAARHGVDCKDAKKMASDIRSEFSHLQLLCQPRLHYFRPLPADEPSWCMSKAAKASKEECISMDDK